MLGSAGALLLWQKACIQKWILGGSLWQKGFWQSLLGCLWQKGSTELWSGPSKEMQNFLPIFCISHIGTPSSLAMNVTAKSLSTKKFLVLKGNLWSFWRRRSKTSSMFLPKKLLQTKGAHMISFRSQVCPLPWWEETVSTSSTPGSLLHYIIFFNYPSRQKVPPTQRLQCLFARIQGALQRDGGCREADQFEIEHGVWPDKTTQIISMLGSKGCWDQAPAPLLGGAAQGGAGWRHWNPWHHAGVHPCTEPADCCLRLCWSFPQRGWVQAEPELCQKVLWCLPRPPQLVSGLGQEALQHHSQVPFCNSPFQECKILEFQDTSQLQVRALCGADFSVGPQLQLWCQSSQTCHKNNGEISNLPSLTIDQAWF